MLTEINATMTLNIYMGYFGDDPGEGACLVFAHTAREAKKISWDVVRWWGCEKFTREISEI